MPPISRRASRASTEIELKNVCVPISNVLLGEGRASSHKTGGMKSVQYYRASDEVSVSSILRVYDSVSTAVRL